MMALVAANETLFKPAAAIPQAEVPVEVAGDLLFMENNNYQSVDALPYIDTQLGQTEVAQQVKALIEEEMGHFEARDYLASLPEPDLPLLSSPEMQEEFARVEAGHPMAGVSIAKYKVEVPQGASADDLEAWKKAADLVQMQLEYSRLRLTNLELLERWGNKAWIASSATTRACERVLTAEASTLRASREEVNKKRKLDQVSCGNELRRLALELEQYQRDNVDTDMGLRTLDMEVAQLKQAAEDRGVPIHDITGEKVEKPEFMDLPEEKVVEVEEKEKEVPAKKAKK